VSGRVGDKFWGRLSLPDIALTAIAQRQRSAAAPGFLLAQGMGRIGNWWNQELYGKPTALPWGLKISESHRTGILPK